MFQNKFNIYFISLFLMIVKSNINDKEKGLKRIIIIY